MKLTPEQQDALKEYIQSLAQIKESKSINLEQVIADLSKRVEALEKLLEGYKNGGYLRDIRIGRIDEYTRTWGIEDAI